MSEDATAEVALRSWPVWAGAVAAVLAFLLAVKLLGAATDAAAPALEVVFERYVGTDAATLGLGWLGAYALGNGSVVAAVALSLFAVGVVSPQQLFLMVAGSRLGAAAIVVFVGAIDYVQKGPYSLRESVSLGLLTFLLTHAVYLPVTVVGYLGLPYLRPGFREVSRGWAVALEPLAFLDPVTSAVTRLAGPGPSVVLAVGLLFGSLKLFDRVLANVDTDTLRERLFGHFRHAWVSFAAGLFVTGVTTSVAFSLGVIVPLYNRGYVDRDELVPYVLGANLGTLLDTLAVALLLGSPVGVAVVLELLGVAAVATLALLLGVDHFGRLVAAAHDRLLGDRRVFAAFAAALVAVPLALVAVPLALG